MKEFEGYRILLADDEDIAREIVANIVEDLGAECVTARDGDELLAKLNDPNGGAFDLVLTDINMPGKSGIDACSAFRASEHPKARTLPFIGISADTNPALFDNAISAGMNGMTMKPLSRETLHAHLHITLKDNKANTVFCERIQQALAKSLFFSSVSHDIRTPLNAIIGFSQLLKMGFETKEEHDGAVDSILVSSNTLLQLVNDILDLSKLESGRMEIVPEPTDSTTLLKEIITSFCIANKKTELDIRFRAGDIPSLMLDPQRIRQIAFNLVGNAVKFTKQGFVELSASFEPTCAEAGTFTLSVQDTGCGISAEDQKRLASPFVQVGAQKAKAGGTGLGLSICRKLAKAMGGDLRIASELGKGTTFSIVVPGVKVVGEELRTESGKCKVKEESSATLHSLRILFADDTKLNHIVMKNMLKKVGVEDVVSAANGREALEILRREGPSRFDLVLTDMFMPEMTGEDLVKEIRADANLSSMPVYVFTADVEIQKCYAEMGFTNFLLKPVSVEKLHTLTSHLNG